MFIKTLDVTKTRILINSRVLIILPGSVIVGSRDTSRWDKFDIDLNTLPWI